MVLEEVLELEEEKHQIAAAGFSKQCTWTKWEQVEQRQISWPTLLQMEPLRISFLLRATYDLLPTASNLKQWGVIQKDMCPECGESRVTLEHVLASCKSSLAKYTWRHNQVLKVLSDMTEKQCYIPSRDADNLVSDPQAVDFVREGSSLRPCRQSRRMRYSLFGGSSDWQVLTEMNLGAWCSHHRLPLPACDHTRLSGPNTAGQ